MPSATSTVTQEREVSAAATSLFASAVWRTRAEAIPSAEEGETTPAQRVVLEEGTLGEPFVISPIARASSQSESSEFDISGTSGAVPATQVKRHEPEIAPDVRPYLTGHMLHLYQILLAIAQTKANTSLLAIEGIRIHMFKDPEENTQEFVLTVMVKANAAQAMAYWDAIGRGVDTWRDGLPAHLKEMLISRWSFQVHWSLDGST